MLIPPATAGKRRPIPGMIATTAPAGCVRPGPVAESKRAVATSAATAP